MRSLFFFLFFFFINHSLIAQNEAEWTLYKSVDGVEIYYHQVDCAALNIPSQVAYILKVVNTTSNSVQVSWDLAVWYNYERLTQNIKEGENHYILDLNPNESLVGDCEVPYGALYVFKDFITYVSPTKLTRFELENLQVAKK